MRLHRPVIGSVSLSLLTAAFLLVGPNQTFWRKGLEYFSGHLDKLVWLGLGLFCLLSAILVIVSVKYVIKPVLIALVLVAASASYYVNTFGVLIDREMIQNVALTTTSEAKHLFTPNLILHLVLFGLLPSLAIAFVRVRHRRFPAKLLYNTLTVFALLGGAALATFLNYSAFASTFRQHRDLIASLNPSAPVVAAFQFASREMEDRNLTPAPLGTDAAKGPLIAKAGKPVLTVFVVGETARAQNFGLNGYEKNTTPELAARGVFNFSNVSSCGTSTAVSVPCMFSNYPRRDYSERKAHSTENLTDVLTHAGVKVEWYDNDTGSMRVAERIPYEFLPATNDPRFCSGGECHDEILVDRLKRALPSVQSDTVIVLHQLGSHGPAYFERYPKDFERFQPACQTAQFADCERAEIVNAYDNTILYTDHVLSEIIDTLKGEDRLSTALFFVSDHGESLGENGLYLHAAPYFIAPSTQTHVPQVAWFSQSYQTAFGIDTSCLKARASADLSHDNVFHTILGLMDVSTSVYSRELDAFAPCRGTGKTLASIGTRP